MVEGPGCKLKGIKIKAKLRGQIVNEVKGNAVEKHTKKRPGETSPFHQLISRELEDVQTLGKELFMYFGEICLRVHFLMSGQSFINNQKVDNDSGGAAETAVLELQMSRDLLTFRKASVDIRPTDPCRQKYVMLNDLDICSPVFNFSRAVAMVMEQQDRQVCDVLLDQSILPGVGNIIKNEVSEIKEEHVTHLIKMTRDFTNIFYVCRRDGKPLYPYYKIYGKRQCKQCEGKVTICRLGDDNGRVTYFCANCQTNDLKKNQRTLPVKNSLLGWVQTGETQKQEWACSVCTLLNLPNQSNCIACMNPRTPLSTGCDKQPIITQQNNSHNVQVTSLTCTTNPLASKGTKRVLTGSLACNAPQTKSRKLDNIPANNKSSSPSLQLNQTANNQNRLPDQCGKSEVVTPSKIPLCPTHKRRCSMKEVRKEGDNRGRWFFSCVVRNCNFFEWADLKFPTCPGHGKPCTIRTVLKIGPNNGKRFFACKMPKNKQCKFFEWAHGYD